MRPQSSFHAALRLHDVLLELVFAIKCAPLSSPSELLIDPFYLSP